MQSILKTFRREILYTTHTHRAKGRDKTDTTNVKSYVPVSRVLCSALFCNFSVNLKKTSGRKRSCLAKVYKIIELDQ